MYWPAGVLCLVAALGAVVRMGPLPLPLPLPLPAGVVTAGAPVPWSVVVAVGSGELTIMVDRYLQGRHTRTQTHTRGVLLF